jgi:pyrrolidone-carboxylate peptidase
LETKIGCHKIDRLILPTVFHDSADMIAKVLKSKNYDVALAKYQSINFMTANFSFQMANSL